MKKLIVILLTIFLFAGVMQAQDGKKMFKMASKNISKFIADPVNNESLLAEGLTSLQSAFEDPKISGSSKYWTKKAQLYNDLADKQIKDILLTPGATFFNEGAAYDAYLSVQKALEISVKKGDTKNALYALQDVEGHLSNFAIELYKAAKYKIAFLNFDAAIKAKEVLNANDKKSRLDDVEVYNDQLFFAGISAYYAMNYEAAQPYFLEIYKLGGADPMVYEGLFVMNKEGDVEGALVYLGEGRVAHPDDTGLLFAEINYYLEKGELDILLEKLKQAQAKEPDNVSVTLTLGNVYDQLATQAREDNDEAKVEEYFGEALRYYNLILEKDANNFDANYSIGALYYNKGAAMTKVINELSNDFSKEGTKKYTALKATMDEEFNKGLPYFEKAITINSDDINTLIALKEIAARSNEFDKANEYKERIEAVEMKAGN